MVGLWIGVLFAAALPLLLLVSLHVCLAGCGSALGCRCSAAALPLLLLVSLHVCLAGLCLLSVALDRRLAAAALPLLLLVSLHVCLAGLCLPSCGSGSALGCRCSAAAPACLPSCLPCWPLSPFLWLWIGAWLPLLCLPLLLLVSLHVCLAGLCLLSVALDRRLAAAALPLLLLVSLHVCLAGLCPPSCGSGSALGCCCSAAAPACLPSCLPCWPLSPFLWLWIGAWLLLLCRCSCLSPFMFALLALVSLPVALDRRLAAAALPAAAPACLPSCLPCWPLSPFMWLWIGAWLPLLCRCSCLSPFMFALLAFVSLPVALDRRLAAAALPLLCLPLLLLVSLHVCLAGLCLLSCGSGSALGCRCSAAAPACLSSSLPCWPLSPFCGSGSALGCRCSAAAPACLPSSLPCWPLSPFLWLWIGVWLPLLCRCSCLSPFMFALLAFVSLPVALDRRLAAAALPLLLLVSLHVCLAGLCLPSCGSGSALGCRCSAAAPACLPSCLPCWPLSPFLWLWIGAWLPLLFRCSCLSSFMFALLAFVSFHVALDRRLAAAALPLLKNPGLKNTCNEHKECL